MTSELFQKRLDQALEGLSGVPVKRCRWESVIMNGWPDEKQDLPAELTPYYSFRNEMSVQDGLIFKGQRVIAPFFMRPEMKTAIHSFYSRIDSCLKRARECLFWPGMTGDIKQFISTIETCCTYQSANQQENFLLNS